MTVWTLVQVLRRRWPVALAGLFLSLVGTYLAASAQGVCYQQVTMMLVAPVGSPRENPFRSGPGSLVSVAGLVARHFPRSAGPLDFSPSATIVDAGITDGVWIRQPNDGNQWVPSFQRAEIDVQVVGPDAPQVRARLAAAVADVRAVLRGSQLAVGAPPDRLIGAAMSPSAPPVFHLRGSSSRAAGGALVLGLGLTLVVTVSVDRRLTARSRPRRRGV